MADMADIPEPSKKPYLLGDFRPRPSAQTPSSDRVTMPKRSADCMCVDADSMRGNVDADSIIGDVDADSMIGNVAADSMISNVAADDSPVVARDTRGGKFFSAIEEQFPQVA